MPTARPQSYIDDTVEVHKKVLAGFRYVKDSVQHPGSIDDWRLPEDFERVTGDCDDFAIACRALLREKGHTPRLLLCLTETGGGHLICVLGKMALDNRQRHSTEIKILTDRIGYTLISISGREPGAPWRMIDGLSR
jgi:predicted transglutaminase-like cysteine proteinase